MCIFNLIKEVVSSSFDLASNLPKICDMVEDILNDITKFKMNLDIVSSAQNVHRFDQ